MNQFLSIKKTVNGGVKIRVPHLPRGVGTPFPGSFFLGDKGRGEGGVPGENIYASADIPGWNFEHRLSPVHEWGGGAVGKAMMWILMEVSQASVEVGP